MKKGCGFMLEPVAQQVLETLFYKKIMLYNDLLDCLKREREHLMGMDLKSLCQWGQRTAISLPERNSCPNAEGEENRLSRDVPYAWKAERRG
jgi:hypothetical protein